MLKKGMDGWMMKTRRMIVEFDCWFQGREIERRN